MGKAEIVLYGVVGSDITAESVLRSIQAAGDDDLTVRVSSPGGEVYQALTVMNALRAHPGHVTTVVEGLAASSASFIAIGGGDTVVCRPNAEIMIHEAWSATTGSAEQLTKDAADLDRVSVTLASIYADKAGTDAGLWREAMKAETWFTADEAVEAGLADQVVDARESKKALAGVFNLAGFRHAGRADAPPPLTAHTGHEQEGESVSFRDDVARRLGVSVDNMDESHVLAALDEVLAEQAGEVLVKVEVTFPESVEVSPTGTVSVGPESQVPEGVTFSLESSPDGWDAEVAEATGELTATAPESASVGDSVDFVITATGGEDTESTELTVTATVVAASDEVGGSDEELTTVVDSARLAELEELAAYGRQAKERDVKAQADRFAVKAVAENKIGSASAERWAQAWLNDRADAESRMAAIRPGMVHRSETGHAVPDQQDEKNTDGYTAREQRAVAQFHGQEG